MQPTSPTPSHGHEEPHRVPLWALFLILLALTAAEVILYDLWVNYRFVPKYALVILILVFTLPKAAIVMTYFMHLKFEKQIIIGLAVVPFVMACGVVLAILSDTLQLKPQAFNRVKAIGVYQTHDEPSQTEPGAHQEPRTQPSEYGY